MKLSRPFTYFARFGVPALVCWMAVGCGEDSDNVTHAPVGTVLAEQTLVLGPTEQIVQLGTGVRGAQLTFPVGVVANRARVVVRLSDGVTKGGAVVSAPVVQIATPVTFVVPARMRQSLVPPPAGRRYVAVSALEPEGNWTVRGPVRFVADGVETQIFELDVLGMGLWGIGEVQEVMDAGAGDAASADGDAGAGDAAFADGGVAPADAAGTIPQLTALSPTSAPDGMAISLTVTGQDFTAGWQIYFGGLALPTTILSDLSAIAAVPAGMTTETGSIAVWLGVPGSPNLQSNILYFNLTPPPGVPVIVDYSPDNGLPGTTVLIVGTDFMSEAFTIKDAAGNLIPPGATGTTTWVGTTRDTVQFVIPEGMPTGPITMTNSKGSFRGRVFNVGQDLARTQGTLATASSQYNTSNWSIASGWDNNLQTSWFSALGDCATLTSCTSKPWFKITFAQLQPVRRVAMRGNREYASGYDFVEGVFEILGPGDVILWSGQYELPAPDRDLDITLPSAIQNVAAIRFSSVADESSEPGFSELEAFAQ